MKIPTPPIKIFNEPFIINESKKTIILQEVNGSLTQIDTEKNKVVCIWNSKKAKTWKRP